MVTMSEKNVLKIIAKGIVKNIDEDGLLIADKNGEERFDFSIFDSLLKKEINLTITCNND